MKKETVLLEDLTCPSCAADLQKALSKMDGVKRAEVAFATATLNVEYDTSIVKPADIERTIEGFGVSVAARL